MNGATGAAGGGAGTGSPLPEARDGRPPQPHHPPQAYQPPQGTPSLPGPQQGRDAGYGPAEGYGPGTVHGQSGRTPRPAARPAPASAQGAGPRTRMARLRIAKADPWSVMKVSFVLSIALGVVTVVAVALLWLVLDALGVFSTVGGMLSDATGANGDKGFDLQSVLSLGRVLTFTSVIAVIDVVLVTAMTTLASFLYNLSSGFVGGIELTLAEDE